MLLDRTISRSQLVTRLRAILACRNFNRGGYACVCLRSEARSIIRTLHVGHDWCGRKVEA
jgi:hypothetical protein